MTRNKVSEESCLIFQVEFKNVDEAYKHDYWIKATKEELEHIEENKTWEQVPRPKHNNITGTKWVFRNKMNEQGEAMRNKQ